MAYQQFQVVRLVDDALAVIVQSDLLDASALRVVVPLVPISGLETASKSLNPAFQIGDEVYHFVPQLIGTVALGEIAKVVLPVRGQRDEITRALDLLFHGV